MMPLVDWKLALLAIIVCSVESLLYLGYQGIYIRCTGRARHSSRKKKDVNDSFTTLCAACGRKLNDSNNTLVAPVVQMVTSKPFDVET